MILINIGFKHARNKIKNSSLATLTSQVISNDNPVTSNNEPVTI